MSLLLQRVLCIGVIVGCLTVANLCYGEPQVSPGALECGYRSREQIRAAFEAAILRGEIARPNPTTLPVIAARQAAPALAIAEPCLTPQQIFLFEDTSQVLLTNFSDGQLFNLMISAANAMLAAQGDNYDFVGFFVNFTPNHTLGAAFYLGWENDVQGIGDSIFNDRAAFGIAGNNIEGFVMMWNINSSFWQPGTGSNANFARLVLGQEFEHRFSMFLPNLADGRSLQGDGAGCGRFGHWNWKVDGQGSGMEISNWVGSSPALPQSLDISFNTDIPNSVFSYSDLYLMGYVTPAEMDAGNSELRFMNTSNCSSNYSGTITNFTSADIITTAGPRIPSATSEDKDYRTGWIMIHLPGSPPTGGELNKAVGIMQQHQTDWNVGTLGRGTMNNTLFTDCNCNGVPDSTDIANGEPDMDGNGVPDVCESIVDTPAASSWGLAILTILVLAIGTVVIRRKAT